ncbi:hypothetical protein CY34DRAFT_617506 [Suillus luteus UH-Slu-Lm8-n1]|uniref:F-box domain-containing protein n=1 Tax=Suillus luteus UH-Slu-Lm8-n1 TaxID=930992 RepID=A0A0D0AS21_9AGAM|nr:hypothetical protein CY34DRAFT_617506 [Suillus luteus UH-Slu-Lm8-n1]
MNFSWSTPLRRKGQTNLPLIPNEIYLHIFECMAPTDQPLKEQDVETFSALALVCRFFCSVALPRIFEQILANSEPAKSLALYVKECTFEYWESDEKTKWLFPFASLFCKAMTRMSNIRKVVFSSSFVKTDHWEALAELKQLEDLGFHFCSFIDDPPNKELTVRSVMLYGPRFTFTLRPIATTSLRSLKADIVEAVLNVVTFRQLAIDELVLHRQIPDIEPLLHVFQHLPNLQILSFSLSRQALASSYGKLSLKRLFTRLRSFTMNVFDAHVPRHDNDDIKMYPISVMDLGPFLA